MMTLEALKIITIGDRQFNPGDRFSTSDIALETVEWLLSPEIGVARIVEEPVPEKEDKKPGKK